MLFEVNIIYDIKGKENFGWYLLLKMILCVCAFEVVHCSDLRFNGTADCWDLSISSD